MTIRRRKSGTTAGLDLLGPHPVGSGGADGLLLEPPSGTGAEPLDSALRAEPPSRRAVRLTGILATCLVAGLAFTGGVLADQRWGSSSPEPGGRGAGLAAGGLPSGMPSGPPGTVPGSVPDGTASDQPSARSSGMPAGQTAAAALTGTVRLVDGSVVYVVDDAGTLTRVEVDDATTYTKLGGSSLGEIGEGDSVTVTGTAAGQGVVRATGVEEGQR